MTDQKPLRLWPGVMFAVSMLVLYFVAPMVLPDVELPVGLMGVLIGAVGVFFWWLFFSRAPWLERIGAVLLMIVAVIVTRSLVHSSIAGAGQGMLIYILPVPVLMLALVIWAAATRQLRAGPRRATLAVAIALACVPFLIIRTDGVSTLVSQYHLRWTPTAEEILLAQAQDEPKPLPPTPTPAPAAVEAPKQPEPVKAAEKPADAPAPDKTKAAPAAPVARVAPARAEWPGFRGPARDSVIRNVRIETDWAASPPTEVWRRPVGPGWSSFSVRGDLFYTQEQRGEEEIVSCYRLSTGEPVWRHRDTVRFYESNGGAGPRATPTIDSDRIYAHGATGILNVLDADSGKLLWSRHVAKDTNRALPIWGFASSPLIVDDLVVVAASGTLAAYDKTSGDLRWKGPSYGGSYSSPHRVTLDGVDQIVLLGGPGTISVSPADGKVLWIHEWVPGPIVQPAVTEDGDLLVNAIAATGGIGTRRLHVTREGDAWKLEERWTTNGLKPYFNDFVVHKGHAFGFDGAILSSINLQDGKRNWKGGRYGNGQMILLAEQDLLLVLSEDGELALVSATTDGYREIARFTALDGKSWNHPVLVGSTLLVRNGEEMAAFRLPLDGGARTSSNTAAVK
jgi:outer membrane protein assembly factor BamB